MAGLRPARPAGTLRAMTDADFAARLSAAATPWDAFAALHARSQAVSPVRLWTVMTVDHAAGVARRAYTSHPDAYPTSGTKPVPEGAWFADLGAGARFVANDIDAIAAVFPDHAAIASLGCASVLNLPVILGGNLAATVNLLDPAGGFPPSRAERIAGGLALPSLAAVAAAHTIGQG